MVYSQENISDNKFKRVFSSDVSEKELVWHRDKENRIVEVMNDSDWEFQMDNELPILLNKGKRLRRSTPYIKAQTRKGSSGSW